MEFKYKTLQEQEGYKIVEFQHSFYNGLKKNLVKQSNKYFKLLNPGNKVKEMFTLVPTQYNHEDVKNAMIVQNTIENEAIGIIVDKTKNNIVFDRVSAAINNSSNDYCALKIGDENIIICPDEVNSVKELKKIINKEIVKYNTENTLSSKENFSIVDISKTEQEYIQDKIKEKLIELIDKGIELDEDIVLLTQLDLGKMVVNKKRLKDIQKLFELLDMTAFVLDNAFYFVKKDKIIVNDYVSKVFSNEIKLKDKVYMYNEKDQTSVAIEPKQQEKHVFKYKNIEEVIKSKTDIHAKNDDIEWTEIDSLNK